MKRLGRRGRSLGQMGSDEDLLDDETKKQLFAGAGITSDILEDMSVEEKQGTLKAILASNPSLLPNLTPERLPALVPVARRRDGGRTPDKQPDTDNKAENLAVQEAVTHIVHGDSSDSISTHSSDGSLSGGCSDFSVVPQPARQLEVTSPAGLDLLPSPSGLGDLVQAGQIMSIDRQMDEELPSPTPLQKPVQLVLDSDEEKVDEEEETQPYDLDCLVAESKVSPQILTHKVMMEEIIPETQTTSSSSDTCSQDESMEIPHLHESIVKQADSSRMPESGSAAVAHPRLHSCVEVEQDVPLTRIYRAQPNQEKASWPSFFAPGTVQDPDVYTDVIKLVLDIYVHRVCRAQKQISQVSRAWGKPVSSGCHMKGCLRARSSRLQDEQAEVIEGRRDRALRRKNPDNQGSSRMGKSRKCDVDEDDDFDLKFPQTLKEDLDSHQRLQREKRKRKVHDKMSAKAVTGCEPPRCHVTDEQNEDVVESEEEDHESDEWMPVKVTRGSVRRNHAMTSGNKQRTQIKENQKKRQDDGDKAESGNVKLSKNVAGNSKKIKQMEIWRTEDRHELDTMVTGNSKKIKQIRTWRTEDDALSVDRREFDAILMGNGTSVQQKYTWSDQEDETVTSQSGSGHAGTESRHTVSNMSKLGSRQIHDVHVKVGRVNAFGQVEELNTDMSVGREVRSHKSEGDETLPWLIDVSNSNEGPDSSQNSDGTTATHWNFETVTLGGSQSSESLLDGQGNLYSTQLSRSAHVPSTDSQLASTSSLQRTRRQGQTTSRVKHTGSCRKTGTLSVDSKVEVKLSHERPRTEVKSQKHEKLSVGETSPHGSSGIASRLGLKHKNTGNCDRSNEDTDASANVTAGVSGVTGTGVMTERTGDGSCHLQQESRLVRSSRCLKRHPVVILQPHADKRRKLHDSADQKKRESYPVSDVRAETPSAASVKSSHGVVSRPLPPEPGHTELLQDNGVSFTDSTCPICGLIFHPSKLEAHASSCGEDADITTEGHSDGQIRCIRCAEQIPKDNIKEHQTHCLHMDIPARRVTRSSRE